MLLTTYCVAQAAAEAQAQARKGMLRGQPSDKRKLNQKGIQRIDSMQFGGVRPPRVMPVFRLKSVQMTAVSLHKGNSSDGLRSVRRSHQSLYSRTPLWGGIPGACSVMLSGDA